MAEQPTGQTCDTIMYQRPRYSPRPCSRRGVVELVCVRAAKVWKLGDRRTVCKQHAKTWQSNRHWAPSVNSEVTP